MRKSDGLILVLASLPLVLAQSVPSDAPASAVLLSSGKTLLRRLNGDSASDASVFREVGPDVAQQLLLAVMNRSLEKTATLDEWTDLHRSLDGLTALEVFRNNPTKAATYALFNDFYYRDHEGDYDAALGAARLSLELEHKAGQPEFIQYKAIGDDLFALGRSAEALQAFRNAENRLPDSADNTAADLKRQIVRSLLAVGNREAARTESAEMKRISENAPPTYRVRALLAECDVLVADGKYRDGIDAIKAALAVTGTGASAEMLSWEVTAQLVAVVIDGVQTLPYEEALALARLADSRIAGLRIQASPFAEMAIRQRRRLAGDLDTVLREDAARVEAARKGEDPHALIEALRSLSVSFAFANGTKQRAAVLEEAVELQKPLMTAEMFPVDSVAQGTYFSTLNQLGRAYSDLGQGPPARRTFDTVLKAYTAFTDATVRAKLRGYQEVALIGKAVATALDDEPDDAREMLQRTLRTVSKENRAEVLLEVGRLERELNEKPVAAMEAYEQAISAMHQTADYPGELAARLALTRYLATNALDRVPDARGKAETHLAAVETIAHQLNYAEAGWRVDFLRGVLAEAAQPGVAIERYESAIAKLDRIRAGLTQQEQREAFLDNESIQEVYARLVALLSRTGQHELAWQYLERGKARSFLELLQGRRFATASVPHGISEPRDLVKLRDMEKHMADLRLELAPDNATLLRAAGREPAMMRRELVSLETQFSAAREEASLVRSRPGQVLSLRPPPLSEIQKALPAGAALIEYGILEGQLTAFVITPHGSEQVSWKTDTKTLRQKTLRLRAALGDSQSGEWTALVDQMSQILVTPIAQRIPEGITSLLIVPSQYLNYLPFQALSLPDGRPILEAYATTVLPSASTLLFLNPAKQAAGDLFLGALGNSATGGMPPLPGTLLETEGISAVYPGATRISGKAFTHDEAYRALTSFDVVHFATHGILDDESPLFSALMTSPGEGQPSQLSLYEIVGSPVRAHLVVLSACETGLGKLRNGDEITGLTRTLLTAGADTVVSSLWKVSDETTAMLMQEFYKRLHGGLAPAAALRESELAVREKYKHPFYWAPFVVTGRS